ncbi:MAG: putative 2OG-Fe(II) oxygenase [Phenylobacterium sp.]
MADPRQAYDLLAKGQIDAALVLTQALVAGSQPKEGALTAHAVVLKAHGRVQEALEVNRQVVARFPASGVAWHNLAATQGDLDLPAEAEASARRAINLGLSAPETRLVLARALQSQGRLDEAETAFAAAVAARPSYVEAHRELAQLVWMRTADAGAALTALDRALASHPRDPRLQHVRATVLEYAGDLAGARAAARAGLAAAPADLQLLGTLVHLEAELDDPEAALAHAQRAVQVAPGSQPAQIILAEARLAAGDARGAAEAARAALQGAAARQYALALLATAWRLLGDPRYVALYDYAAFVRTYELEAPAGWIDRTSLLKDLAEALGRLHGFRTHPLSQSLRHGGQVPLRGNGSHEAPIEALLAQLSGFAQAYARALGPGADPFRARNSGAARIAGAWSVRLTSSGFHADHIHPEGWISSACYIALPEETRDPAARAGWLKFGEPGVRTHPSLGPEHFVEPLAGRLVLFPSYMWHGTVPFVSQAPRLTVAFDAVPA